jgi:atypical dual specificity phosphatase
MPFWNARQPADSPNPPSAEIAWVIPGKLAVGELPRTEKLQRLERSGIRAILSLCDVSEGKLPEETAQRFRTNCLVLPDSHYDRRLTAADLIAATDIIHQSLQAGQPIYVHCLAGMERSPTACIAYLCRYDGQELWDALEWVKTVRPQASPTKSQLQAIEQMMKEV